jgi:hypothetical protein
MTDLNLNEIWIDNDGNYKDVEQVDNSLTDPERLVKVYFRNLEAHLIDHIKRAEAVFGCVAWLTSIPILDALAKKDAVSLVVQKEDFLRPDLGSQENWKQFLHKKYKSLKCPLERYSFSNVIGSLSLCSDPTLDPVRCVGNYNRDKSSAFPRMHNKFLIFAKLLDLSIGKDTPGEQIKILPYAVWTGSFNLTKNAVKSLENALYITDRDIVQAYYREYGQIIAISEPLDWTKDWIEPEWRIGT